MTHETGIHRADAELALGIVPTFAEEIASDGINEFFENLWRARAWRRSMGALRGDGERIRFVANDTGEHWLVVRQPNGFDWSHRSDSRDPGADAGVSATVQDLYLFCWKRLRLDSLQVTLDGNRELLRHWYRYSSV